MLVEEITETIRRLRLGMVVSKGKIKPEMIKILAKMELHLKKKSKRMENELQIIEKNTSPQNSTTL